MYSTLELGDNSLDTAHEEYLVMMLGGYLVTTIEGGSRLFFVFYQALNASEPR
jgi:hypothetical protein